MKENMALLLIKSAIRTSNCPKVEDILNRLDKQSIDPMKWIQILNLTCSTNDKLNLDILDLLLTHIPLLLSPDVQSQAKSLSQCAIFNLTDAAEIILAQAESTYCPPGEKTSDAKINGLGINAALEIAMNSGFCGFIDLMLKQGAVLPNLNFRGETPGHVMVRLRDHDTLEYLLQQGHIVPDTHLGGAPSGDTPLLFGIKSLGKKAPESLMEITEILVNHGANTNFADPNGVTPLHLAAFYGIPGLYKYLRLHKADDTALNSNGETALSLLISNDRQLELYLQDDPMLTDNDRIHSGPPEPMLAEEEERKKKMSPC